MILKLPLVSLHPGWLTALKVGVVGVDGAEFTVAIKELPEVHDPKVAVTE